MQGKFSCQWNFLICVLKWDNFTCFSQYLQTALPRNPCLLLMWSGHTCQSSVWRPSFCRRGTCAGVPRCEPGRGPPGKAFGWRPLDSSRIDIASPAEYASFSCVQIGFVSWWRLFHQRRRRGLSRNCRGPSCGPWRELSKTALNWRRAHSWSLPLQQKRNHHE